MVIVLKSNVMGNSPFLFLEYDIWKAYARCG